MEELVTYPMPKVMAAGFPTNRAIKSSSSTCNLVVPDSHGKLRGFNTCSVTKKAEVSYLRQPEHCKR